MEVVEVQRDILRPWRLQDAFEDRRWWSEVDLPRAVGPVRRYRELSFLAAVSGSLAAVPDGVLLAVPQSVPVHRCAPIRPAGHLPPEVMVDTN